MSSDPLPLHSQLSNDQHRPSFAAFLDRLAAGGIGPADWEVHAVTHYTDGQLESIRRDLIRLMIHRDTGGYPVWLPADREQFRAWAERLRNSAVA